MTIRYQHEPFQVVKAEIRRADMRRTCKLRKQKIFDAIICTTIIESLQTACSILIFHQRTV